MKPKASIYGPWVNRRGEYFPKAPPGIVLLRTLGVMPLKAHPRPGNKNQSKP